MHRTPTDRDLGTDDVRVSLRVSMDLETLPEPTMIAVGNAVADKMIKNVSCSAEPPSKDAFAVVGVRKLSSK